MPPLSIDLNDALQEVAHVENALIDGHAPPGIAKPGDNTNKGAIRVAALRLRCDVNELRRRVGTPDGMMGVIERRFGVTVDWSLYRPKQHPPPNEPQAPVQVPEGPPADPIVVRRLRDENAGLRNLLKAAEQRAAAAEDLRAGVLGLMSLPPQPITFTTRPGGPEQAETAILMLSDLHWGEVVSLESMDGINSYNLAIARARLGRWAINAGDLLTKHWSGPPPNRVIIILGGDLISGGIHLELAKTDALGPLPAVRDVADHLQAAILHIRSVVKCPIDIISLPGNHGRSTIKPESKEVSETSYDVLVSDFLERGLKGQRGISFYAPASPDALFPVYGWRVLATHGDKIGSRGGQGFIGPAATAARGMKRLFADYATRGVHLDLILIGHFHCDLKLEEGWVNNSLIGPSEFSRDGRFKPKPAMQNFFTIHPRRLLTQWRPVDVGHPDEGSLYEAPPPDRELRPRYRVRAPSVKT